MTNTSGSLASERPTPGLRAEVKSLLFLSVPIILSQLAQIATGVVDVVMAGHLGPVELGAVSTGAAVWTPTMIFLLGLVYVVTHMVGALRGQNREHDIPSCMGKAIMSGFCGGLLLGASIFFGAAPLFRLVSVSPELVGEATVYTRAVAFAFPGLGLFVAFRFLLEASGGAGIVTLATLGGIVLKILLNNVLVFGAFGFSPMGTEGFGLSTVIVFWAMAAMLVAACLLKPDLRRLLPLSRKDMDVSLPSLLAFVRKGLPIAFNFLSDYLVMAVVALCIASIGPVAISSHQVVFNIVSVLLMLTTGVGMAGAITVSNALNSTAQAGMRRAVGICLAVSITLSLVITAGLVTCGDGLVRLYTDDSDIIELAAEIVDVAALLFTVDVAAISLGFILRGLGRPGTPMLVMLVAHWGVSIPLGYVLAETGWMTAPLGVTGWWYGLLGGLVLATLGLAQRLGCSLATASEGGSE